MKTVLLLRHAKSSWGSPELADFDRPLNDRGKRDAPRVGNLIKHHGLTPDLIISSNAKRARKTAARVARNCEYRREIELEDAFYLAAAATYVQRLHGLADDCSSVMLVGHNPGMEELLEWLTGKIEFMPTAALARVEFNIQSWTEVSLRTGELIDLWRPKELVEH